MLKRPLGTTNRRNQTEHRTASARSWLLLLAFSGKNRDPISARSRHSSENISTLYKSSFYVCIFRRVRSSLGHCQRCSFLNLDFGVGNDDDGVALVNVDDPHLQVGRNTNGSVLNVMMSFFVHQEQVPPLSNSSSSFCDSCEM